MNVLAIARVDLVRFLRDRSNLFFVFVLPLLLVVFIGAQFAGEAPVQIGLVGGDDPATQELRDRLEESGRVGIVQYTDESALVDDVSRARVSAGVVIPDGFGESLGGLEPVEIGFIGRPDASSQSLRRAFEAAVAAQTESADAAAVAAQFAPQTPEELVVVAGVARQNTPGVTVASREVGGDPLAQEFAGLGQFDLGASSQLFLFVFLTSMTAGAALIRSRQLGMVRRMLATNTPVSSVLLGHVAGRYAIALTQALYIVGATWLLFRVNWGDALATTALVLAFCLVSAGAGMLLGVTLRNESQAGGAGVGIGLLFAALGGSMAPLEIFPEGMRRIAMATPHGWANTAMATIVRRDGGIADIVTELSVLVGYAVVLLAVATVLLRRSMAR